MDVSHIKLLTDLTAILVFSVILITAYIIGYLARADELYKRASLNGMECCAVMAWYPFVSSVTLSKLAGVDPIWLVLSECLCFASVIAAAVAVILQKAVTVTVLVAFALYILYSVVHIAVAKRYLNKYRPHIGLGYIAFASFVPMFKYFIHIRFFNGNDPNKC